MKLFILALCLVCTVAVAEEFYVDGVEGIDTNIVWDKYLCPVHGEMDYAGMQFTVEDDPELNGQYCVKCIAEWYQENLPKMEIVP